MAVAPRGAKVARTCECCPATFTARVADVKRGWARFCSKRCKAIKQGGGQSAERLHDLDMAGVETGWDGHKEIF